VTSRRRIARIALILVALAALGAAGVLMSTAPQRHARAGAAPEGNPLAGERVFLAGGCASCHAAEDAEGPEKLVLSGGQVLASDFGSFTVPNISPHPQAGIGGWTHWDFADAMRHGTSPDGAHYYPAFPYTSYVRMTDRDLTDLLAYIRTLPESDQTNPGHTLKFPYNIRAGLGLWKVLNLDPQPVVAVSDDPQIARGRYLVEGPGHCGECHTPRGPLGGLRSDVWLAGAPNPEGEGRIPNITPHPDALVWSAGDIAYYLETGFDPDFDSAGGTMVAVIENLAGLPAEDRAAIAAYLKAVPPIAPQ